jgi:hypothetical protein
MGSENGQTGGFFQISNEVVRWSEWWKLSTTRVALYLCKLVDEDGRCWPALGTMARDLNMARRTIQRSICQLEAEGLVTVYRSATDDEGYGEYSNTYEVSETLRPRAVHRPPEGRCVDPEGAVPTPPHGRSLDPGGGGLQTALPITSNNQQPVTNTKNGKEEPTPQKDKTKRRKAFTPPTVDEIAAYCQERGNTVDPEGFWAYYEQCGWRTHKGPVKNWKACVITFEKNQKANGKPKQKSIAEIDWAKHSKVLNPNGQTGV